MIRVIVVGSLKSFARKVPVLSDGRAAASKGSGSNTSLGTASRGVLPIRPFADRWVLWREFAGHRLCGWLEAMLPYQVVTVDIGHRGRSGSITCRNLPPKRADPDLAPEATTVAIGIHPFRGRDTGERARPDQEHVADRRTQK
jgi:hypothetical protein